MSDFRWIEIDEKSPHIEAVIATQPATAAACYQAARGLRKRGYFGPAARMYEKALGLDEHHHATWAELVDSLVRANQLDVAEKRSLDALNQYGQVRLFYAARALVLAHRGRYDEADEHSRVSLDGPDARWYSHCVRAEILLRQSHKNRFQALDALEAALAMPGATWETFFLGGWAFLSVDLPTFAASFFAEAAHTSPRAAVCWICLGDAFRALRFYNQAHFYYGCAVQLDPDNQLVVQRQKSVAEKAFGLLHALLPVEMRDRWAKRMEEDANP